MAGADFLPKLRGRIDRGVDVATQTGLRAGQGIGYGREGNVAHHQDIDITVAAQLATCRRAEHECDLNPLGQRDEALTNDIDDPDRLQQEHVQLRKDRALAVGLEEDMPALYGAPQDSRLREEAELALDGPLRGAGFAHKLAQVEPLVGMTEEPTEDAPPCPAEQDRRGLSGAWIEG